MDVILVNSPVKGSSRHASLELPLGLAYIAAVLLKAGYSVSAVDLNISGFNPQLLRGILERDKPRILGISVTTETYPNGLKIAEIAKEIDPGITVVMGGPHPTIRYGDVLKGKNVDVVVRGEGEYSMLEVVECIIGKKDLAGAEKTASSGDVEARSGAVTMGKECDLSQIKGIAYKVSSHEDSAYDETPFLKKEWFPPSTYSSYKTNPERPFIEDPDELPFPARELFSLPLYTSPGNVLMSRGGCPFKCRFCAVNNIWKGSRRFRKPEKVVEEIVYLLKTGQAKEIAFADDIFTLNRGRVMELCALLKDLKESLPLRWTCASRVDLVDKELLETMREAGCYAIQFGVESGSQYILDSMFKGITIEQVRVAVRAALDVGMKVLCAFMFPQPLDTEETIYEQGQFMKELLAMGAQETLTFTTPLPGTDYFAKADQAWVPEISEKPGLDELGIKILANDWDDYDAKHLIITTKYLSEEQLNSLFRELVKDVGLTNDGAQSLVS